MINCAKCGVDAKDVFVFQMSRPFFERPREFLCAKCGGNSPLESVHRVRKVHESIKNSMITLTKEEVLYCRKYARLRNEGASKAGYESQRVDPNQTDEDIHFTGLMGEIACMRYFGFPTHVTLGTYKAADLPHNIEVRARTNSLYDCKVLPNDNDTRRVVMVIIFSPHKPIKVVGWITALEGKAYRLINPYKKKPFHAVPQKNLRSMEELRDIIEAEKKISPHKV